MTTSERRLEAIINILKTYTKPRDEYYSIVSAQDLALKIMEVMYD